MIYYGGIVKTHGLGEIVEITIPESDNKPVFTFGRAFIRIGKTNQKLSNQEVKDLVKRYEITSFDGQITNLRFEELEFELLNYIKNNPGERLAHISKQINYPVKTLERWVKLLKNDNKIEYRGSTKKGGYFFLNN